MTTMTEREERRTARLTIRRNMLDWLIVGGLALLVGGCTLDGMLGTEQLPEDVTDPATIETPKGALRAYHGTIYEFERAFGSLSGWQNVVSAVGLLTDELQWANANTTADRPVLLVDRRDTPEGGEVDPFARNGYGWLHKVRGQASQAIGLLRDYAPDSLVALSGHLYAIKAYAEIFLADLYCSGIPLSTVDYNGDFTYRPGSSTDEVYEHAIALLDTAYLLTADSTDFQHLARVGRARALLNLGRFAEAAAAVSEVPDDFRYLVTYQSDHTNFARINISSLTGAWDVTVSDNEGINGLDFRSSGDPRSRTSMLGPAGFAIYHPDKYSSDGSTPIVLASGIEARLIEAEALLDAGDPTWLDKLNHLRQTMWTTIEPAATGPLPDLTDPGSDGARVDLLYRERALWLFLTGQRQGDLRRLMRHYGRAQEEVYPVGTYMGAAGFGLRYGSFVNLPVPEQERISNPHYNGCFTRN